MILALFIIGILSFAALILIGLCVFRIAVRAKIYMLDDDDQ